MISRRSFLHRSSAASLGAIAAGSGVLGAASDAEPLYKISLAQWSLNTLFQAKGGDMDNLDFAATAKKEFGIDAIEYSNQMFLDRGADKAYHKEMKQRQDDAGVKGLLIMIDKEGRLGDPNPKLRTQAVENHYKWIEAAQFLGCHSLRVNAASEGTWEEQVDLAADGLRRLTEFGADHGLNVIVENHGGLSSNGKWLAEVMRKVDHPKVGTLPDFGNFVIDKKTGEEYDRYLGVEELMPFAKAVSAKSHEFDAEGNEIHTDYPKMMRIVVDSGYNGYVGIEFEKDAIPKFEGVRLTKALLENVRDEIAAERA